MLVPTRAASGCSRVSFWWCWPEGFFPRGYGVQLCLRKLQVVFGVFAALLMAFGRGGLGVRVLRSRSVGIVPDGSKKEQL